MPKESEDKIDACEAANPAASSSLNASDKDPGNSCTAEVSFQYLYNSEKPK